MTIEIEALEFNTIIGLLDFERITPQKVRVDLELDYNYTNKNFINYADLVIIIKNNIITKKYELLEDALIDLEKEIIKTYKNIERLKIKITKPDILDDCIVSISNELRITALGN